MNFLSLQTMHVFSSFTKCYFILQADFTVQSQLSASADAATIWQYKTVTNLRLKLVTPSPILGDYEILEWVVEGSCMCNGHASTCVPFPGDSNTSLVFSGCLCEHNTAGDHCGKCAVGYNSLPWRPGNATSANACQRKLLICEWWYMVTLHK